MQRSESKHKIGLKIIAVLLAVVLIFGISVGAATLVHRKSGVLANTTVKNGLSAYELAVQYGYNGTVQEWLSSLNGKSAYEIAVENGYTGTEKDWTASLKANADTAPTSIKTAAFSQNGELLITLSDGTVLNLGKAVGADGKNGANGQNGKDGTNGQDGVGISAADMNEDGQLVLTFSDGTTVNLDRVVGMNGADGVGVANSIINENGELVLTYTNGQTANLGVVVGADGRDGVDGVNGRDGADGINGTNGQDGRDGISIVRSAINASGELVLTYSDNTTANLGVVVGANGRDGVDGANGRDGIDGANGQDGIGVTNAQINSDGELVLTYSNGQRSNLGNIIGADGQNGRDGVDGINGTDGQDGISVVNSEINARGELVLTYSDHTTANLGVVVGANGRDGVDGTNGIDGQDGRDGADGVGISNITISEDGELGITLTNGTTLNLGNIKGAKGDKGDKGEAGANGADGRDGVDGANGADGQDGVGVTSTSINAAGELFITYTDGTTENLGVVVGADGHDGVDGVNGADGSDGADGQDGIGVASTSINAAGELVITYTDGTSANLGVVVGADGHDGVDGMNGADGRDGADGQDGVGISNVEINTADELVLTFSDGASINLGNIKGAKGDQGEKGEKGDKGDAGINGADGRDGVDGVNGADGVGIADVTISASGVLSVTLTNGTVLNLGNIKGADGIGITNVEINAAGELVLTLSDGTTMNLGNIKGAKGDTGDAGINGTDGADGVGIATVTVATDGTLTVTLTNGTALNLGNIKGEKGDKGDKGDTGEKGDKGDKGDPGADGRGIANMEIVDGALVVTYTDGTIQDLGSFASTDTDMLDFKLLSNGDLEVSITSENYFIAREISIPSTFAGRKVTKIADDGFWNCQNLETITLPNTITEIGSGAFNYCKALKTITLPNSLKAIGKNAFSNSGLTTIFIPASVTTIGFHIAPDSLTTAYFEKKTGWKRTGLLKTNSTITSYPYDATSTISDPASAADLLKYSVQSSSSEFSSYALKNQE